jgi:hypothetical protein
MVINKERSSNGKLWVRVTTPASGSLVAFEDLYNMIQGIIDCEIEKYPNVKDPARMPRRFLFDCCFSPPLPFSKLAEKYDLPRPDSSQPPAPSIPASRQGCPKCRGEWREIGPEGYICEVGHHFTMSGQIAELWG